MVKDASRTRKRRLSSVSVESINKSKILKYFSMRFLCHKVFQYLVSLNEIVTLGLGIKIATYGTSSLNFRLSVLSEWVGYCLTTLVTQDVEAFRNNDEKVIELQFFTQVTMFSFAIKNSDIHTHTNTFSVQWHRVIDIHTFLRYLMIHIITYLQWTTYNDALR